MRIVLDTNVIISALLINTSVPARVLRYAEDNATVLYSADGLDELGHVLARPKLSRYLDPDQIPEILARIKRSWELVEILHRISACIDPNDDKFLDLAVGGHATHIISGDRHLLALHPFRSVSILTPAQFLDQTRQAGTLS